MESAPTIYNEGHQDDGWEIYNLTTLDLVFIILPCAFSPSIYLAPLSLSFAIKLQNPKGEKKEKFCLDMTQCNVKSTELVVSKDMMLSADLVEWKRQNVVCPEHKPENLKTKASSHSSLANRHFKRLSRSGEFLETVSTSSIVLRRDKAKQIVLHPGIEWQENPHDPPSLSFGHWPFNVELTWQLETVRSCHRRV